MHIKDYYIFLENGFPLCLSLSLIIFLVPKSALSEINSYSSLLLINESIVYLYLPFLLFKFIYLAVPGLSSAHEVLVVARELSTDACGI